METAQDFYRGHGPMTALGAGATDLRALPRDIKSLCETIQGVLIHRDIAPFLYDRKLTTEERDSANNRRVADMLATIQSLDQRPLSGARGARTRMPCVCSHFSTMFAGILRELGVPARARCGFGAYFNPGKYEDHWVGEYWNDSQQRWVLVDAQIDPIQRKAFKLDFDPVDVPRDRFIIAGDAWQRCSSGRNDPNLFGLSFLNEAGMWWIAANLIRDLASLNRIEMLPWDVWGIMPEPTTQISDEQIALFDKVAALTLAGDDALPQIREIYQDERLRVPSRVFNVDRKMEESVAL